MEQIAFACFVQQKIKEVENRRAAEDREKAKIEQERIKKTEFEIKEKARLKDIADKKAKEERRNKIISFAKNIPTPVNLAKKIFGPVITKNNVMQRQNYLAFGMQKDLSQKKNWLNSIY